MPTKTTKDAGTEYRVDGKHFIWTTEDGDEVTIPLRLKLKVLRSVGSDSELNAETMFAMLEALIPGQVAALDEMDVNDFVRMFQAWQGEYNTLNGATLGEASSSPA